MRYIKRFDEIRLSDTPLVGGKTSSLGEMYTHLAGQGVTVPPGFAITADAYWYFIRSNNLLDSMKSIMSQCANTQDEIQLHPVGYVRALIEHGTMPQDLIDEIQPHIKICRACVVSLMWMLQFAHRLQQRICPAHRLQDNKKHICISAVMNNSFNIAKRVLHRYLLIALLLTALQKGFDQLSFALSIAVQKMVRSDLACSGVAFSLDTDTGLKML